MPKRIIHKGVFSFLNVFNILRICGKAKVGIKAPFVIESRGLVRTLKMIPSKLCCQNTQKNTSHNSMCFKSESLRLVTTGNLSKNKVGNKLENNVFVYVT